MKTETIPHQAKPKSIMDLTPFEIATIEAFQNRNRGFIDETDEDLENDFMNWEDWSWHATQLIKFSLK